MGPSQKGHAGRALRGRLTCCLGSNTKNFISRTFRHREIVYKNHKVTFYKINFFFFAISLEF